MDLIVLVPTLSLACLVFAGVLILRSTALGVGFGLLTLYIVSSFSVLIGLLSTLAASPAVFATSSILILLAALYFARKTGVWPNWWSLSGALAFSLFSVVSQVASRVWGLSSAAFTDGHTILRLGQTFQGADEELLEGTKALKRGFALPALQSFGFDGEYLVGFMPLFFLGALAVTLNFIRAVSPNRKVFMAVSAVVLAIVFSTEAILRHIYLMNTHSTAWLITAFLLSLLARYQKGNFGKAEIIALLSSFVTIGFLRLDFLLLFSPFILVFVLISAPTSRRLAFAGVAATIVPPWLWLTFATSNFPFGGALGPTIISAVGLLAAGFVILLQGTSSSPVKPLSGSLLLFLAGSVLIITMLLVNIPSSLNAIFINLFLGEGLWGTSIVFLLLFGLVSFFVKKEKSTTEFDKAAMRLFISSVVVYLFTKYLDGATSGSFLPGLARVGFGDSLNRTLVTWLPFAFLPLVRIFSVFWPQSSANGKTSLTPGGDQNSPKTGKQRSKAS